VRLQLASLYQLSIEGPLSSICCCQSSIWCFSFCPPGKTPLWSNPPFYFRTQWLACKHYGPYMYC